ncbi:4449_t:CDS:2, partial [Racocetra fulgida]
MQHAIGSLTDLALKKELQEAGELQEVDQEAKNNDKNDNYNVEKDDQKEKDQGVQESSCSDSDSSDSNGSGGSAISSAAFITPGVKLSIEGPTIIPMVPFGCLVQ